MTVNYTIKVLYIMSNQANNKRIATNTLLLTIRMLVVMVIGLYSTRVVLRVLGVTDFGIYNVVGGFVSMFAFINASMSNGIQRFYNYEYGKNGGGTLSHVYNTAFRIQFFISVIIFIATETIGLWYLYEKMVIPEERFSAAFYCFHFSVCSLVLSIMQLPFSALVMAHERMNFYAMLSILDALLKLIIVIALPSIYGDHLIVYGFLFMMITIVNFVLYVFYVNKNFKEDVRYGKGEKLLYKEMLSFTGWNFFGSFGNVLRDQGLNMILNLFFGTVVNAARGIAFQVMGACKSFVSNITTAARPQMTQSYAEGNLHRSIAIMNGMSKACFMSFLLLSLPVVIEIEFILNIWLGHEVPDYTQVFIVIIIAETMIDVFTPPISFMVHATGKMKKYQLVSTIINLLTLPVAYLFLKEGYLPYYVFIVTFVFSLIRQSVSVFILSTLVSFSVWKYVIDVVIPMIFVVSFSIILPLLAHYCLPMGWWRLIVVGTTAILCVAVSSFIIGLNEKERGLIMQIVRIKLQKK